MRLPVSLVLPTRNAMGVIESHVAALRDCLSAVEEIIVVDSSEDGTLDWLRTALDGLDARFFSRPRGLYESWNFAAQQAGGEFVYFSTMGDTIDLAGLQYLVDCARNCDAEILLSPPAMFDEHGQEIEAQWPIHALVSSLSVTEPIILPAIECFLFAVTFVPQTLLGSSASNLYRRDFLAAHPFPEAWGHCADSAWFVSHSLQAKIAVAPRRIGRFVVHPREEGNKDSIEVERRQYDDMFRRAASSLAEASLPGAEREILAGWLYALRQRDQQLHDRLEMHAVYFARRDERIRAANERGDRFKARIATLEEEIRDAKQKITTMRGRLWDYEQRHRSLYSVAGLYVRAKLAQLSTLWKKLTQRS